MSETTTLKGLLPVLQMPFTPDDEVDGLTLRREIDWVFDHGADGVTTGLVSEYLRLTPAEYVETAEIVAAAARVSGKTAVVSCGGESTRAVLQRARHAERVGATAVMAIPPLSATLGDDATYGYYASVIEAIDIPVVIQDASGYMGRPMSIAVQARLFGDYGERVYFKPETPPLGPRVTELLDATGGAARIIEGSGGIALIDAYRRGVVATMPAADLVWATKGLWDALEAGDDAASYAIAGPLTQIISTQTNIDIFIALEKYNLKNQGVFLNTLRRQPHDYEPDSASLAEFDRLLAQLRTAVGIEEVAANA